MRVVAINGSPKAKGQGMSARMIGQLETILGEEMKTVQATQLMQAQTPPEAFVDLLDADALLIVHPLYVDSLPAPLIAILTKLEAASRSSISKPMVFSIAHCGYFEPVHTALALNMAEHFACRAGLPWGYGLGVGGGPMLAGFDNWGNGPASTVYHALRNMAAAIQKKETGENIFVTPNFPRFLYKAMANSGWRHEARRNGVRELRTRPYTDKGGPL